MTARAVVPVVLVCSALLMGSALADSSPARAKTAAAGPPANTCDTTRLVGTWFEPWYNRTTGSDWLRGGPGKRSAVQLLGDVTGDGRDDAVVVDAGKWWLAASDGSSFRTYAHALSGLGSDGNRLLLADVNGDGRADAVAYADGTWTIAISAGSSFGTPTVWRTGFGTGSTKQFVADTNGDARADAITYTAGEWSTARSTGGAFQPGVPWGTFGADSDEQLVGDINGDHQVDAVAVDLETGDWAGAINDGDRLGTASSWISGFEPGPANEPLLGDVTGDGVADAVSYHSDGTWYLTESNGTAFANPHQLPAFRVGYGGNWPIDAPFGRGATRVFVGNVYGSEDPTMSLVAFDRDSGHWQAKGVNNYKFKNRWEDWHIDYLPESAPGVFAQYDSGDPAVIQFQLAQLADAGIDFVIFDATNTLHADNSTILDRNIAIAHQIALWNSDPDHRPIRYAIAVGGINYSQDPQTFEQEVGEVWEIFANHPVVGGPDNYFQLDGEPLIVLYTWLEMRRTWERASIDKTRSDRFSVRFAEGPIREGYYGWFNPPGGPIANPEVMFVTPRRARDIGDVGTWFGRSLKYYKESWKTAIENDPRIVIAGAYNDYAENNWIAPTDTSQLPPDMDKYRDPKETGRYEAWDLTKRFIRAYKTAPRTPCEVSAIGE